MDFMLFPMLLIFYLIYRRVRASKLGEVEYRIIRSKHKTLLYISMVIIGVGILFDIKMLIDYLQTESIFYYNMLLKGLRSTILGIVFICEVYFQQEIRSQGININHNFLSWDEIEYMQIENKSFDDVMFNFWTNKKSILNKGNKEVEMTIDTKQSEEVKSLLNQNVKIIENC